MPETDLPDPPTGAPSLYIHWPYCQRKCPYCDFNVYPGKVGKGALPEATLVRALQNDLAWQVEGQALAPLETIYFGGGTPSLLSPHSIEKLIDTALTVWPQTTCSQTKTPQITLEVHPSSADQAKFKSFRHAGVNRLSIGVQSFDDQALAFLGREHSGAEARAAVQAARDLFDAVSLDLISALPAMALDAQTAQIDQALALEVDHLSVYQLGIEAGTAFAAAVARGDWHPMDADRAADFYTAAAAQIKAAGLPAYEVSNFAKPGFESRHSLLGWQGRAYVGLGPGAEGRAHLADGTWRQRITHRRPQAYATEVATRGHGLAVDAALSPEDRAVEQLIFGLRLTQGLPRNATPWKLVPEARLHALLESGDLEETTTHRRATATGRLRLDALSDYLLNHAR